MISPAPRPALLLFDIDGTLVEGGPAKDAFRLALEEAFGTTGAIEVHEFSGKTDPQIARELLTGAGLSDAEVDAGFPRLWRRYLSELEARLPERPMRVLGGVRDLLDHLESVGDVALGLLTGNIVEGARLKLRSAGLEERFGGFEMGAFGSDHERRNELPRIAVERAREKVGRELVGREVVVIGDTPRDVECGRAHGCATVAVATGNFGVTALEKTGADVVLESFEETERALRYLLGDGPGSGGAP